MTLLENPKYTPNILLNRIIEMLELPSDAALARSISMTTSYVCKIRQRQIPIRETMLWRLHILTGVPAKTLMEWGGVE